MAEPIFWEYCECTVVNYSSFSGTLPGAEVTSTRASTALRPSTGSNTSRPPRTQRPAVQVKAEQNCSPALGEKLSQGTPVSATISSTSPGAEGLQATAPGTAPAMWPSTPPADNKHDFDARARMRQAREKSRRMREECKRALRILRKEIREQNRNPASASRSTAAVVKVEGEGTSIAGNELRAGRFKLSHADLVSDAHLTLKNKADKLQVSVTLLKNRRKGAGLGRWPGRRVRAEMKRALKRAQAQ